MVEIETQSMLEELKTEDLSQFGAKIKGINLDSDELCYYGENRYYTWKEEQTRIKRTYYQGTNAGGIIKQKEVTDWEDVFIGVPFITNKRIIFTNKNGMKSINLSSILGTKSFFKGTHLYHESGKLIVLVAEDARKFNIILERIINDDIKGNKDLIT